MKRTMIVRKNSLTVEEVSKDHGIKIIVEYFILPKEPIGALVRRVKLENIGGKTVKAEVLDGAAKIIPRGISNGQFQEMSNLFKSWTDVRNCENNAPIFAMRASTADSAQVEEIRDGYFYLCVGDGKAAPFICDAEEIFGYDTSLCFPVEFEQKSIKDMKLSRPVVNKVPCAFTPLAAELKDRETMIWTSYLGYTPSESFLNELTETFLGRGYASSRFALANELAEELTADVRTETAYPAFTCTAVSTEIPSAITISLP